MNNDLSISVEMESEINKVTRATGLNVLRAMVLPTPVDTGRARGNWQASLVTPIETITNTSDKSGGSTINKGAVVISTAKSTRYPIIWISNNLPYIESLNSGSSTQAPAKFIETGIKRVVNSNG